MKKIIKVINKILSYSEVIMCWIGLGGFYVYVMYALQAPWWITCPIGISLGYTIRSIEQWMRRDN